jgi:hypothetical protein
MAPLHHKVLKNRLSMAIRATHPDRVTVEWLHFFCSLGLRTPHGPFQETL